MNLYTRLGRAAHVVKVYERCRAALTAHRGITPSLETERLFSTLSARLA
jgi:hypothetical protein